MSKLLFPEQRICCICLCAATRNRGRVIPGEPMIETITPYFYTRRGKGFRTACRGVSICSECLIRTLMHADLVWHPSGRSLAKAFQESILVHYQKTLYPESK